jgi:molybdenum cofactor biosynthesis protein B
MGSDTGDTMLALGVAVLTVTDTRTAENDTSGDYLDAAARDAGHRVVDRAR